MDSNENGIDGILGDVKPIESGTAARDLTDLLGRHRAAIRHLDAQRGEDRQQIERMIGDAQRTLTAAQQQASAQWIAAGDDTDVDRRYFNGEALQLGIKTERTIRPDGEAIEIKRHGLLTAPAGTSPAHEDLIRAYQALGMSYRIASRQSNHARNPWGHPLVARQWIRFTEAARQLGGRSGDYLRKIISGEIDIRAISGSAGSGGELISQPTISAVRRPTDLARRIPGLVVSREVPSSTFKAPIVTGRALAKRRGTTANDPSRYPVSNFTSADTSISVFDRTITAILDMLWATDNGLVLGDPIGFVMDWLMQGDADSLEMAFLHGDTAGTHMDTLSTWTMGGLYTAGDLDGSDSMLKAWIGFRGRAHDDSKTTSAGGTFAAATHFAAMDLLGVRAGTGGVVAMTGLHALYTQILPLADFTTVDKFGPRATLLTGEIGAIGGVPVIVSQMLPNQFDSSSGLYTGSNASSIMVYADTSAYCHYEHAAGSDDFDVSYPERGAQYVGMVKRSVLAPEVISTETPCAVVYNL